MLAEDVTKTFDLALKASGYDQVYVVHKPRLLKDNGSSYVCSDLAEWLRGERHEAFSRRAISSANTGQDRAMTPNL